MKKENEIIAYNIKALRKKESLTQDEFGKQFGSNQKSMFSYEKGIFTPKSAFMMAMGKKYGISPDLLMTLKLKFDRTGAIVNLPAKDKQILAMRSDLKVIIATFKQATKDFIEGIENLNERLEQLEKAKKK